MDWVNVSGNRNQASSGKNGPMLSLTMMDACDRHCCAKVKPRPRPTLVAWRVWKAFPFQRNYLMIFLFVIQFRFASLSDMTKVVFRCLFASPGGRRRTAMAWHFLLPESFLAKN